MWWLYYLLLIVVATEAGNTILSILTVKVCKLYFVHRLLHYKESYISVKLTILTVPILTMLIVS